MNNSEVRGRGTEDGSQRTDGGVGSLQSPPLEGCPQGGVGRAVTDRKTRSGMTLIEVMLAAAILGILAVAMTTALFYPRYLVVNSSLEQSAIHAGTAEIERHLNNTNNPAASGDFGTAGWAPVINQPDINDTFDRGEDFGGDIGDKAHYRTIKTTIEYRDGKTVELITYRSVMVTNSERGAL